MGETQQKPAALLLLIVPMLTIFGNALVIIAVSRERTLQTRVNMLIVSLAASDFLVALCVMTFSIYFEVNAFVWELGPVLCNVYLGIYIAISHPLAYAQSGVVSGGRTWMSLCSVWGLSIAVGLPILLGVNRVDDIQKCEFTNPYFIIVSSVLSFFLPCLAMIALYSVVFKRLRQRQRARFVRQAPTSRAEDKDRISKGLFGSVNIARQMGKHFKNRTDQILFEFSFQTSSFPTQSYSSEEDEKEATKRMPPPPPPLPPPLQVVEKDIETNELFRRSFGEHLQELFPFIDGSCSHASSSPSTTPTREQRCREQRVHHRRTKAFREENNNMATTPTTTGTSDELRSWGDSLRVCRAGIWKQMTGWRKAPSRLQLVKKASKQIRREHKATVTLAVVLVFLICWLPFFVLHLTNAVCLLTQADNCVHFLAFFFTTWLGYLNSSLNPLIYTLFDQRFRKAFRQILHCPSK